MISQPNIVPASLLLWQVSKLRNLLATISPSTRGTLCRVTRRQSDNRATGQHFVNTGVMLRIILLEFFLLNGTSLESVCCVTFVVLFRERRRTWLCSFARSLKSFWRVPQIHCIEKHEVQLHFCYRVRENELLLSVAAVIRVGGARFRFRIV